MAAPRAAGESPRGTIEFDSLADVACALGFSNVASGPRVRSPYHADKQAAEDF